MLLQSKRIRVVSRSVSRDGKEIIQKLRLTNIDCECKLQANNQDSSKKFWYALPFTDIGHFRTWGCAYKITIKNLDLVPHWRARFTLNLR